MHVVRKSIPTAFCWILIEWLEKGFQYIKWKPFISPYELKPYLSVFVLFAVLRHVHLVGPLPRGVALHRREHDRGPVVLVQLPQNLLSASASKNM